MKTVLITGAGGQLGSVVTSHFLKKGYKVIAIVHNRASFGVATHPQLVVEVADLASEREARALAERAITEHGPVDGALLLAGGFAMGNIRNTSIGDIKAQLAQNFDTAYNIVQPLFSHMLDRHSGRIVLISSRPGLHPAQGKNMLAYALSKAMLVQLAELLNETAKGTQVTVTVVAPSTIDTETNRKSMPDAPFENWVKPERLAELFEFICSDTASILRETVLKAYHNA